MEEPNCPPHHWQVTQLDGSEQAWTCCKCNLTRRVDQADCQRARLHYRAAKGA